MAVSAVLALQKPYRSAFPSCQIVDKKSYIVSSALRGVHQVCQLKSFITFTHCQVIMKKNYDKQEIACELGGQTSPDTRLTMGNYCNHATIDSIILQYKQSPVRCEHSREQACGSCCLMEEETQKFISGMPFQLLVSFPALSQVFQGI